MNTLPLRVRLTVWYTLVLLAVLSLFGAVVLWRQGQIGLRRVDRELAALAATLGSVMRDEIREGAPTPAQEAIDTIGAHGHAIAILDARGRTLAIEGSGFAMPPLDSGVADRAWTAETAGGPWRASVRREEIAGTTYLMLAATPMTDVMREQRESQEAMAVAIPVALLLAALGGLWLAAVGLRPIRDMASRASRITADGSDDLGGSDRHDELGQLARAFNGLLGRLRRTLRSQRQFMADASHELRTPVSVIRSAADITLSREHRDEPEYREALTIVGEQGRRVTRLVDDMVALARADTDGGYPLQRTRLYVDDIVADCARTVALLAEERGVAVTTSAAGELALDGDEELLRRMLLNVVRNAVQHTPAGKRVSVETAVRDDRLTIDVTNQGSPIPEADRERIFDRFVQLDPSRRANGSGLGLPIARWIAQAHGGTLTLKPGGSCETTFSITLPLH